MRLKHKRIRLVDGFRVRNSYPDFDVVESYATSGDVRDGHVSPFIPEGEVWFDRRFLDEKPFLLKVHALELAKRYWHYDKVRAHLKRVLCRKGTPPPFVVRRRRRNGLTLLYVRGEIVRQWMDPAFVFGGHDLIYDYIPEGEVWIDIRQDPREIPFTELHELHEREVMRRLLRRGMSRGRAYAVGHKAATDVEREARNRKPRRAVRPMRMRPFRQRAGYCGPASLKIVTEAFGRVYTENGLADLCGTTAESGTDHADLVRGAKAIGATVHEAKARGSLADLRRWVLRERVPVIVGWISPEDWRNPRWDEDHFSVVYHLTRTHVYLMDPETESGRRKLPIPRFLPLWRDTDGPKDRKVRRWFMAVSFKDHLRPPK